MCRQTLQMGSKDAWHDSQFSSIFVENESYTNFFGKFMDIYGLYGCVYLGGHS
jgi:hypothetical protein